MWFKVNYELKIKSSFNLQSEIIIIKNTVNYHGNDLYISMV